MDATPEQARQAVVWLLSGRDPLPAVDAGDVIPIDSPPDPAELLTAADVAAVWWDRPLGGTRGLGDRQVGGVEYRWCSIELLAPPTAWLAVAAAQVTVEAFDRYSAALVPAAAAVEGVGDRATFEPRSGALRVLSGSTLLVLTIGPGQPRSLELATALARRVLARLGP